MTAFIRYLPVLLLLAIWEAVGRFGLVSTEMLPPLSTVLPRWWELAITGDLLPHASASLFRVAVGLGLSIVVGMAIGVPMAVSRTVELLLRPFITFLYPLPKSALIPIIIIWFGLGNGSQITVIFLGCLLPVVLSSFNGARSVDTILVWSARSLGSSTHKSVFDVVVRAAMPEIFAGIRVSLALSFVLLVSAEMIGARKGMGYLISFLGEAGEYPGMFAAILTVVVFGFVADRIYLAFVRYFLRWREVA